jgi:hypothetical protein
MSATLTTKSLTEWTRDLLQRVLPSEFRFFKSFGHFRKVFNGGISYLVIDAVTHGRGWYHLAFYLGVRHDVLERQIHELLRLDRKLSHYDRSIRCYTVNIGPDSPHRRYAIRGSWSFAVVDELPAAASPIVTFVADLAVPFLRQHESIQAVRRTLVEEPGHAQNLEPYRQILMIDRILGDEQQATVDLAMLEKRYAGLRDRPLREFHEFRNRFLKRGGV